MQADQVANQKTQGQSSTSVGDIYNTTYWGDGYFAVNTQGELCAVNPAEPHATQSSLSGLVKTLQAQGVNLPCLVRFEHILRHRVARQCHAFALAKQRDNYQGDYLCVYPIKVNQQRWVVDEIIACHAPEQQRLVGLEAGSKPELLACLALVKSPPSVLVCNGYKDREYIRLALSGTQLGLTVFLVVEKPDEIPLIIQEAQELGIKPLIGLRVRLDTVSEGKWQNTGGEKSKFGLTAQQILNACNQLQTAGLMSSLQLLHFHMGSQVNSANAIGRCVAEAARVWSAVKKLGAKELSWLDVGGGLGVDYEGTQSRTTFSLNYSVEEYASVVVHAIAQMCALNGFDHPHIITESGRNLTAHHACLLVPVVGLEANAQSMNDSLNISPEMLAQNNESSLIFDLYSNYQRLQAGVTVREIKECFHQVIYAFQEIKHSFPSGACSLKAKAWAESLYYSCLTAIRSQLDPLIKNHQQMLDDLNERLAEKIFLNFSIFQSIPDKWGIDQVFPIAPLHGLLSPKITRRGKLQDITCDSDGQIDLYVDGMGVETTFPMPDDFKVGDTLGIFLVGAYQEILGDLHNLFGDTNSVNVSINQASGEFEILTVNHGETIQAVLKAVDYDAELLKQQLKLRCEQAHISAAERQLFESWLIQSLQSSVYLQK